MYSEAQHFEFCTNSLNDLEFDFNTYTEGLVISFEEGGRTFLAHPLPLDRVKHFAPSLIEWKCFAPPPPLQYGNNFKLHKNYS